jgi:uncharacterized protein YjbJ (UPF0337 family)
MCSVLSTASAASSPPSKLQRGVTMNWTQIEGKWDQVKGQVRSQWAKLTDDDVNNLAGKKDQLVGKIVERYGVAKDDAEQQIDAWLKRFNARGDNDIS